MDDGVMGVLDELEHEGLGEDVVDASFVGVDRSIRTYS